MNNLACIIRPLVFVMTALHSLVKGNSLLQKNGNTKNNTTRLYRIFTFIKRFLVTGTDKSRDDPSPVSTTLSVPHLIAYGGYCLGYNLLPSGHGIKFFNSPFSRGQVFRPERPSGYSRGEAPLKLNNKNISPKGAKGHAVFRAQYKINSLGKISILFFRPFGAGYPLFL